MYKVKEIYPYFSVFNTANEYIVSCSNRDNAELIKFILNYDQQFKRAYIQKQKIGKNSPIFS